jgi:translocation and assembly module TamB
MRVVGVVQRIIGLLLAPVFLLLATILATVAGVLFTPPGHALLTRFAQQWITSQVAGQVTIGSIGGNIISHIALNRVTIRDQHGVLLIATPHLEASYNIAGLLARRMIFRNVTADSLQLHLVKSRAGRWNYEEVFHLGEKPKSGRPPANVAFINLQLHDSKLQIDVPTTPGARSVPASRNARPAMQTPIDSSADGPIRIYVASELNARLPLLRISTPRSDPLLARIGLLQAHLNDPQVRITQLAGQVIAGGDSLRFQFDSAGLPDSHLAGAGAVRWPHDTLLFDFTLNAPRIALHDLWWIQPDFPDWTGRGHIVAKAVNGSHTDYRLTNLDLGDEHSHASGNVTVAVDAHRGTGMMGLDMQLRSVPIDVLRPYLDTLPVAGDLTGHLLANGFLDSLSLGGNLLYADALVAGAPESHFVIDGVIHFGGDQGAVFQRFRLNQSAIALGTVHQLVPSVLVRGVLDLNGTLDGPWKNAAFVGQVQHVAPDSSVSRLTGNVRLDTRGLVLGLAMDGELDPLSFDALRSGYPDLPSRGTLVGHVSATGSLDSLLLDANLTGEIGTLHAQGRVRLNAPNYGADSLVLDLLRLDAEALSGRGTSTSLNGRIVATGAIDSGVPPRGTLTVTLDQSRIGGATVDAVTGVVHAANDLLTIDTAAVVWRDGQISAKGTLGWTAADSGTLAMTASATTLTPFDSLLRAVTGMAPDTIHPHPLDGRATATLAVAGSLDRNVVTGTIDGTGLLIDNIHAARIHAGLRADSLGKLGLAIDVTADTAGVDDHVADRLHVVASGRPDSLRVAAAMVMAGLAASGGGVMRDSAGGKAIALDSLTLASPHQVLILAHPSALAVANAQVTLRDTVELRSRDGSGQVRISGVTPGATPGKLDASIDGLDLLSVFSVLGRDTTELDGIGALDIHVAGTRSAPTIKGAATLLSPTLGDTHFPTIKATFDYANQRLQSEVSLWKTGQSVLHGTASLPIDFALESRSERKLPGPVQISARADSVDMVLLAALIPSITDPRGRFSLALDGNGTWQSPHLTGHVAFDSGSVGLPSLGVTYGPINGSARFVADSLVVDSMQLTSGGGTLRVKGGFRFAQLSHPNMDLLLTMQQFQAINEPSFMTLHTSGVVRLDGPVFQPRLTGDGLVLANSVIYFADLISKDVVDLEDPAYASIIDTAEVHRLGLGNQFSNRFLDSLRIDLLRVRMGDNVWLRSAQANVQLEGSLLVGKDHKVYSLQGTLTAPRGTYTLQIGPINRDFTVDQGNVAYYGTPDLNAEINIQAHNQVRTVDGDDINVVAAITGTIRAPKVTLTSPGRNISQRDLVSYVLFGKSEFAIGSQQGTDVTGSAITLALDALGGQIEQKLLNGASGIGLTSLTIRPGVAPGGVVSGSALTQLAAGVRVGSRTFVTLDAGICFTGQQNYFQSRNFGASIDYRFSRTLRVQLTAEPVQSCATNRAADVFTTLNRYQFGANLLWQRDY